MIKTTIAFDIPWNGRNEGHSWLCYPINYGRFQTFCIIRSSTGGPFLKLRPVMKIISEQPNSLRGLTITAMEWISSSDSVSISLSSRPGTDLSNLRNTWCSRRSLYQKLNLLSARSNWNPWTNLLCSESLLWLVRALAHANDAIIY